MKIIGLMTFFAASMAAASPYDTAVLADRPMMYLTLSAQAGVAIEKDLSSHGHNGTYRSQNGSPKKTKMPNGDTATAFDGKSQYLEVPSAASLSVKQGGAMTIEAWIRPDVLQFPKTEGEGFVYWMGKGEPNQQEYAGRMYSKQNSVNRPNRISGYVYNPSGHLGSGSYFQDTVKVKEWLHVAIVIDTRNGGTIAIFKNGDLRQTTPFSQFNVHPQAGNAPLRIATRQLDSFFQGAVGKFALYARALSSAQLKAHVGKMR